AARADDSCDNYSYHRMSFSPTTERSFRNQAPLEGAPDARRFPDRRAGATLWPLRRRTVHRPTVALLSPRRRRPHPVIAPSWRPQPTGFRPSDLYGAVPGNLPGRPDRRAARGSGAPAETTWYRRLNLLASLHG